MMIVMRKTPLLLYKPKQNTHPTHTQVGMGAMANDSTIGVGFLFITPSVVVLLLYMCFFG